MHKILFLPDSRWPTYFSNGDAPIFGLHPAHWVYLVLTVAMLCGLFAIYLFRRRRATLSPSRLALLAFVPCIVGSICAPWQVHLFDQAARGRQIGIDEVEMMGLWASSYTIHIGVYSSVLLSLCFTPLLYRLMRRGPAATIPLTADKAK